MHYQMNEPMPELPLEPEDWRGSDEWSEKADLLREINEQKLLDMYENWDESQ